VHVTGTIVRYCWCFVKQKSEAPNLFAIT